MKKLRDFIDNLPVLDMSDAGEPVNWAFAYPEGKPEAEVELDFLFRLKNYTDSHAIMFTVRPYLQKPQHGKRVMYCQFKRRRLLLSDTKFRNQQTAREIRANAPKESGAIH